MKSILRCAGLILFMVSLLPVSVLGATYTLVTQTNGNGAVGRNPTNSVLPGGAVVTLTAVPASGWYFGEWSGGLTGTNNPVNVTMSSNTTIMASFLPLPDYALAVSISGNGFVVPSSGTYQSNTVVAITATPSNGWFFHHWSGDASGSANPLNLTMSGNKSLTANFVQPPTIVIQPINAVANAGENASFFVSAIGTEPLSYEWRFNDVLLSGGTGAVLNLTNVQNSQAGSYRVVVRSPYGAATSHVATLVVSCPGTNIVLVCTDADLRRAVAAGGDVRFCCNGTITLTNTITIDRDVTLDGTGMAVTVSGGNAVRLFNVSTGVSFTVSNLMLADGWKSGTNGVNAVGAIPAQHGEPASGGAIFNAGGSVRLVSCVLSNNHVQGGNGGAGNSAESNGNGGTGSGGGIWNRNGNLSLANVLAINNSARGGAAGIYSSFMWFTGVGGSASGGAIYNEDGHVVVVGSRFQSNVTQAACGPASDSSTGSGGALFHSGDLCEILDSEFSLNRAAGASATGFGGTSPFNSGASARGGALAALQGTVIIRGTRFSSNTTVGGDSYRYSGLGEARGGAVYNSANMTMHDAQVTGSLARPGAGGDGRGPASGWGGGIFNAAALEITGSTVADNIVHGSRGYCVGTIYGSGGTPAYGGGICNIATGSIRSTNCTLALNQAVGGAPCSFPVSAGAAYGGGLYNEGAATMVNVTVASNTVVTLDSFQPGPAAGANVANTNGTLTFLNSILAYPGTNANAWGPVIDAGFNISSDGSSGFNSGSSFNFTDPGLLALRNYGGATLTMALTTDSPAIDFGTSAGAPSVDQRGLSRPFGLGFDIGAYEAGPLVPALTVRRAGTDVNLSFQAAAATAYRVDSTSDLVHWEALEAFAPVPLGGVISRTYPLSAPTRFFRLSLDF